MPVRRTPSARPALLGSLPALLVALAAACGEATAVAPPEDATASARLVGACDGPATSLPAHLAAALSSTPGFRTMDDHWAALSRRVPGGFAGVMYDTPPSGAGRVQGRPILMLVDPSRAAEAKAALGSEIAGFDVAGADVRAVRWSFAQLYDWYRHLNGIAWQEQSVTLSDIDEGANRITYGAATEAARDRLVQRLAGLDLPCELVAVKVVEPAVTRPGR